MNADPIDRADLSRLLWRAALAVEKGDPITAAEFLELAAKHLRGKEVKEPTPEPAGTTGEAV
jgi:hypothetical protein